MTMPDLPGPQLRWDGPTPLETHCGDSYFSRDDGYAESQHVFIHHTDLAQRLACGEARAIGELGFGTGLNFLLCWQLWRAAEGNNRRHPLDYVAFERSPWRPAEQRRALARWPVLAPLLAQLQSALPPPTAGFHPVTLEQGRLRLLLVYGDAAEQLPRLRAQIDTWFLDGFAPARDPVLWRPAILAAVAGCSRPGARFATFTAASQVRRDLASAGFTVRTAPGFGRKREMLCGHYAGASSDTAAPWFRYPPPQWGPAAVIGGGLSAAWTARTLAESGRAVTLLAGTPDGASQRIARMLVRAYPEAAASPTSEIYAAAAAFAVGEYRRCCPAAFQTSTIAGQPALSPAGVLAPTQALTALLDHPGISVQRRHLRDLQWQADHWRLITDSDTRDHAGPILFCCAELPVALRDTLAVNTQPVSGQCVEIEAQAGLTAPWSARGQLLPAGAVAWLGSSYRTGSREIDIRADETAALLAQAQADWPAFCGRPSGQAGAAVRIASPDHLPLLGPWPDTPAWQRDYAALHHGRAPSHYPVASLRPGLWLNLAHGSRGASLAPLAARLLLGALDGTPLPLPQEQLAALHPGRFLIRRLRRRPTDANPAADTPAPSPRGWA